MTFSFSTKPEFAEPFRLTGREEEDPPIPSVSQPQPTPSIPSPNAMLNQRVFYSAKSLARTSYIPVDNEN